MSSCKETPYNLPCHITGDTYDAVRFEVSVNEIPQSFQNTQIIAEFVCGPIVKTLSLGAGLSIVDADAGIFQIDQQIIDWQPGLYNYKIKFIFPYNLIRTWITGTFEIKTR